MWRECVRVVVKRLLSTLLLYSALPGWKDSSLGLILAALLEDTSLILSTHIVALNHLWLWSQEVRGTLLASLSIRHTHVVYRHKYRQSKTLIHILWLKEFLKRNKKDMVSHWTRNSPFCLGWLVSELTGSTCLHPTPSHCWGDIVWRCAWLCLWVLGFGLGSFPLHWKYSCLWAVSVAPSFF